jgi:4-hydroxy-3-methylbut-2-enyl diphosphate reductase IspH
MKRSLLTALGLALVLAFSAGALAKEEKKAETKTISGKSACATCDGVTKAGHNIMLVDKDGTRWVLIGDSASYKEAHKVRHEGKTMTATYAGDPQVKKGEDGKDYKEVKVSDVKVEA